MRIRLAAAGAVFGAASLVSSAVASTAARVAIVVRPPPDAGNTAFESQLRAELLAAGFEVLTVARPGTPDRALLADVASRTDSFAAIAIVRPEGSISAEVWVTDRVTGKTLLREVRPEGLDPDAASIFALRAVELLRASLLEINESHPPRGTVPAPAVARAWVAPPEPPAPSASAAPPAEARPQAPPSPTNAWLGAGVATLASSGGVPVSFAPTLSFGWRASPRFAGDLFASGPARSTVERASGTATLDEELVAARAHLVLASADARIAPMLHVGAGAAHVGVTGHASGAFVGASGHVFTAIGLAGGGFAWRAGRSLALRVEIDGLLAANRPVLAFAGGDALVIGRASVLASAGMEFGW